MEDVTYNLIEEIVVNNYQWSSESGQPNRFGGKLEIDALTLLSTELDVMSQRLDPLNVNAVSSSSPPPCEIDPLTI